MSDTEDFDDERWKRLSRAFFPPPPPPSEAKVEAFIARLADKLEERTSPPLWRLLGQPWLAPALGLALASVLFVIRVQTPEAPVPLVATLLTTPQTQGAALLAFVPHTASPLDGEP
jgi:hypothetical protein